MATAQHVGVLLHVQAVLQAQRQELFLAQLAGHEAFDLIAKLRNPLEHQCPVIIVVLIHRGYLIKRIGLCCTIPLERACSRKRSTRRHRCECQTLREQAHSYRLGGVSWARL